MQYNYEIAIKFESNRELTLSEIVALESLLTIQVQEPMAISNGEWVKATYSTSNVKVDSDDEE